MTKEGSILIVTGIVLLTLWWVLLSLIVELGMISLAVHYMAMKDQILA